MLVLIIFIIFLLLTVVVYIASETVYSHPISAGCYIILFFANILCGIALVITSIVSVCHTCNIKITNKVKSYTIVNLVDNSNTKGNFFLGCGSLNSEEYYYYYYKTSSNSYKLNKVEADKCEIIYTDDTPHIDTNVKVADKKASDSCLTLPFIVKLKTIDNDKYKIYVPKGTITTDFSIDNKDE